MMFETYAVFEDVSGKSQICNFAFKIEHLISIEEILKDEDDEDLGNCYLHISGMVSAVKVTDTYEDILKILNDRNKVYAILN